MMQLQSKSNRSEQPSAKNPSSVELAELVQKEPISIVWSPQRSTWIKIAILSGLMLFLQMPHLRWLVKKWISDPNWSHGFVIPLFSLYLLYSRRNALFAAKPRISVWGLVLMILCLAGEILGIFPVRNYWVSQLFMVGMIFGLVWYLAGGQVMRVVWLPILFLIFAIPLPELLYSRIALPLQNFAARGAVAMLQLFKVSISSIASSLHIISRSGVERNLTVAEACSGMRLLMAFLALGVAMAYLDYKPIWQRIILVIAAIPIAIFCNVIRVAITCWMYYIDEPELGQDFMHHFTGVLMLIPAFAMLWVLAWIIQHIFVEETES
ncbi:MAG: hypothetical protein DRI52_12080 [Chloroflexi bacterium]|nr:MAG: hypothetical protein DRI52_12080 [Chloroflexota bacterium]